MNTINFKIKGLNENHNGTATIVDHYDSGVDNAISDLAGIVTTRKIGVFEGYIIYENYYDSGSDDYSYFAIKNNKINKQTT